MSDDTDQEEKDSDQEEKTDLEKQEEAAKQEVAELEDDPPQELEDWPDGDAKYKTFGGPDSEGKGYDEGPTVNLGASNVRHHEDGSVTVDGEEVDNPDDYKGEPIPGGPTDPDSKPMPGDKSMGQAGSDNDDDSDDDDSDDDDSDDSGKDRESGDTEGSSDRDSEKDDD